MRVPGEEEDWDSEEEGKKGGGAPFLDNSWYEGANLGRSTSINALSLMDLSGAAKEREKRRDSMFLGEREYASGKSRPDIRLDDIGIHDLGGGGSAVISSQNLAAGDEYEGSKVIGDVSPVAGVFPVLPGKQINDVVTGSEQGDVGWDEVDETSLQARVSTFLDSIWYMIIISFITLYVLYIDDIVVVAALDQTEGNKTLLLVFLILKVVAFFFFLVEFGVFLWARWTTYPLSFFFWLDVLALVSFIPDCLELFFGITSLGIAGSLAISRAGRAAQASARAVRASKLTKASPIGTFENQIDEFNRMSGLAPSQIGAKLIQVTTNKVTVLVLLIYFASLLLQVSPPLEAPIEASIEAIEAAVTAAGPSGIVSDTLVPALVNGYDGSDMNLLHMWSQGNTLAGSQGAVDILHNVYVVKVVSRSGSSGAEYCIKHSVRLNSGLNIVLITILLATLILGSFLISKDADRLIKVAINRITTAVMSLYQAIAKKKMEADGGIHAELGLVTQMKNHNNEGSSKKNDKGGSKTNEAQILLNMLNNIGERAGSDAALVRRLRDQREEYLVAAKRMEMELRQWRRTKPTAHIGKIPLFSSVKDSSDPISSDWISFAQQPSSPRVEDGKETGASSAVVAAGSVPGLIGWLVSDLEPIPHVPPGEILDFAYVMLVNYRSFMDPAALLEDLIMAYCRATPTVAGSRHRLIEDGITPEELHLVREMFERFDTDGNGVLSREELGSVLLELDRGCTEADVDLLMSRLDEDGSGEVEFSEFFNGMNSLISTREATLATWRKAVLRPIRERVALILEYWIEQFTGDFVASPELRSLTLSFVSLFLPETGMADEGVSLTAILEKALADAEGAGSHVPPVTRPPLLPRVPTTTSVLVRVDPVEIARQLTLVESRMYGAIRQTELVDGAHMSEDKDTLAPNVSALVAHHNAVSRWVEASILEPTKTKERASVIKLFIHVMVACSQLSNFNGVMEIYAALQGTAIDRLKRTWAKVHKDVMEELEAVGVLMSYERNFKNYRVHVADREGPVVPYLGISFKDLIGIDEGNEKRTPEGLINFERCYQTAHVISDLLRFQPRVPQYSFVPLDDIQSLWRPFFEVKDLVLPLGFAVEDGWQPNPPSENDLYQLSLVREPRRK